MNTAKMDIVRNRKIWFGISLLIIIPGIIIMLYRTATMGSPFNLGIDFTGGNLFNVTFKVDTNESSIRSALEDMKLGKSIGIQMSGNRTALIRTPELDDEKQDRLLKLLNDKVGAIDKTSLRVDKVGAVIGKELTMNALLALAIAAVLMIIYISFRFEFKFGIAAVLALLHDVLVVFTLFSLFWWEVDSAFVAAILTIIGYSINDTIVIFDRIRENMRKRKKGYELEDLVNDSIWQTMTRSINTVLTVVMVLVALLIFGGPTIRYFTLAMLIGVVSGAYSSIFNASQLWVVFKKMEGGKARA